MRYIYWINSLTDNFTPLNFSNYNLTRTQLIKEINHYLTYYYVDIVTIKRFPLTKEFSND